MNSGIIAHESKYSLALKSAYIDVVNITQDPFYGFQCREH